ncbi:MAG: radical SAM protein [Thermodesulfobacteriota bacterium]
MRIAVIAPPYPLEEGPAPPLGICYVAAAFEKTGAEVRIFDFVVSGYSRKKLAALMEDFSPDAVGITSVTLNFHQAAAIISDAKEISPGAVTMMGGPHVTFTAEETLASYPALDLLVLGEGEETIAELMPVLGEKSAWKNVRGIMFRENGSLTATGPRPLIADLDTLPLPARRLLPINRYRAMGYPVSITTSRGCPHQCIFCQGRRLVGAKMRFRSVPAVADEIEEILSLGFTRINVADDLFTARKERVLSFCETVRSRGLNFSWGAFSRVNTLDLETAKAMAGAGCDCVSFGLETGNQEMLDRIKKAATLEQARVAVDICKQAGLLVHGSLIAGLPGETPRTLAESKEFAESLNISHGWHKLAPFPGTTVMDRVADYDLEILTRDWSLYDANHAIVRTRAVSPEDIDEYVADYDRTCARLWKELEDKMADGTATPMERLRIEGTHRLPLIYAILSGDLIEKFGEGIEDSDPAGSLGILAGRISRETGADPDMTRRTLAFFAEKNMIRFASGNGFPSWQWAPVAPRAQSRSTQLLAAAG